MALADFLHDLFTSGAALPDAEPWNKDKDDAAACLAVFDQAAARDAHHLPGEAPDLDAAAALWAAAWFHEACRVLLRRDVAAQELEKNLKELAPPAAADPAAAAWSADLVLRHLPEFLRRAVMLSPEDPLIQAARTLAGEWPLSGAGIKGLALPEKSSALEAVLGHPTLRRLLADRLVAADDPAWLAHPGCRAAVAEALGGQAAALAPALAKALGEGELAPAPAAERPAASSAQAASAEPTDDPASPSFP